MASRNPIYLATFLTGLFLSAAITTAAPRLRSPTIPAVPAGPEIAPLDATSTQHLSAHIWMIPGYPNIPIIVGEKAVLVVDTGLGTAAGRVIAQEAKRLGGDKPLYVTTTHFHPEHAAGMAGFPPGTILLRPSVQQQELDIDRGRMLARFREHNDKALTDADYGRPQLFDTEKTLDLGGVTARIFWAGPAHTHGDTLVYVAQDRALISGDTVQNHATPTFLGGGIGPAEWLNTLTPIARLKPKLVIPDHSPPGPGVAMIAAEQDFLRTLIAMTDQARKEGMSQDAAVQKVMSQLHDHYPNWTLNPLTADGIRRAYSAGGAS